MEGKFMMKYNTRPANEVIDRILELSADAHIQRRKVAKGSPAFHNVTGAIAAYGRVLALLTALQEREEFHATVGQNGLSEYAAAVS